MAQVIKVISGPETGEVTAAAGDRLLAVLRQAGWRISAPCGGNGTCGKCRVKLISGAIETEKNPHLSQEDFDAQWRLACQSSVHGDAVIWVPMSASAFRNNIKTADLSSPEELARYEAMTGRILTEFFPEDAKRSGWRKGGAGR